MRYYVVADVHGFYSELQAALTEKGKGFMKTKNHINLWFAVICSIVAVKP